MLKLKLTEENDEALRDPHAAFAQLLAYFLWAAKRPGQALQRSVPTSVWQHPEFSVAQKRMLERLRMGIQTSIEDDNAIYGETVNFGPGIGRWSSNSVLLVGDRTSHSWRKGVSWPFISGMRSGCSVWLAEYLEEHKVPENRLYWVNAYGETGKAIEAGFVSELRPRGIVALGGNAVKWCMQNQLKHERVHHPQYWHKFQKGKTYVLPRTIKALLGV